MTKREDSVATDRIPLYNATRGLASQWLRAFCAAHLKQFRADGWTVQKTNIWTQSGGPMSECRECPGDLAVSVDPTAVRNAGDDGDAGKGGTR